MNLDQVQRLCTELNEHALAVRGHNAEPAITSRNIGDDYGMRVSILLDRVNTVQIVHEFPDPSVIDLPFLLMFIKTVYTGYHMGIKRGEERLRANFAANLDQLFKEPRS